MSRQQPSVTTAEDCPLVRQVTIPIVGPYPLTLPDDAAYPIRVQPDVTALSTTSGGILHLEPAMRIRCSLDHDHIVALRFKA